MTAQLALVIGDPAGIGGELMAGLLADPEALGDARIIVVAIAACCGLESRSPAWN